LTDSQTTSFAARHFAPCAFLAASCLALSAGCGAPANAPATTNATPEQAPAASANAPVTATANENAAPAGTADIDPAATSVAGRVKLSGRIAFEGPVPERRVINTSKDAKCAEIHGGKPLLDEDLIVGGDGGVKNAFVFVRKGAPKIDYPRPEQAAEINQQGCMFRPRVQGVRVGQRLMVGNADPVTHNVRSFPKGNRAFNFGQPPGTEPRERVFERAEREIEVQCDIHPWMHAYIFVMDHPFYSVSQDDGTYTIENLPPGEYTLESWHEKLGRQRTTLTVADRDLVDVNFKYSQ
jgi:hypothetical protein